MRKEAWIGAALFAFVAFGLGGVPLAADANECNAGCRVPLRGCVMVAKETRGTCQESCELLAPGRALGACLQQCALAGKDDFGECRAEFHACRTECIETPVPCRTECIDSIRGCGVSARAEASLCRSTCREQAAELRAQCLEEGGDRETCGEEAGAFRGECLDGCGSAQSSDLEACGQTFEQCILACTPPDGEEAPPETE